MSAGIVNFAYSIDRWQENECSRGHISAVGTKLGGAVSSCRALCRMLFVTGLGDERRATLDSLLHRIGCTGIECYPPNGVIDIICYTYGNMDGFTARYVYCNNRSADMDFYEDRDLHEMWKEYAPDKANRPMPRKRLDDHWSIEYRP